MSSNHELCDELYYHDLNSLNTVDFFSKYHQNEETSFNDFAIEYSKKTFHFCDISSDVLCYIIMNYLDWKTVFKSCLLVNKDFFRRIANNRILFINLFNELFVMKQKELDEMGFNSNFKHKNKIDGTKYGGLGIPNEHYHYWKDYNYYYRSNPENYLLLNSIRNFHIKTRLMTESKLKLIREKWNSAIQLLRKAKNTKILSNREENQALLNLIKRIIKDRLFLRKCFNNEFKSINIANYEPEYYMRKHSISLQEGRKMFMNEASSAQQIENMINGVMEYSMYEIEEITVGNCMQCNNCSNDFFIESIGKYEYAYCDNVISFCSNDFGEEDRHISYLRSEKFKEVFETFPNLKSFISRGVFQNIIPVKSNHLTVLVLLSGGMPAEMLRSLLNCEFPQLKHLELWLGSYSCGNTVQARDFYDLLTPEENGKYPLLEYFGIRNAEQADQYLVPIANSNLLKRLRIFDMSLCGRVFGLAFSGQPMIQFARRLEELGSQSFPLLELVDFHTNYLTESEKQTLIEIFNRLEIIVDVTNHTATQIVISE